MSNRINLSDEMVETVAGGRITFTWRYQEGTCGINGNNIYSFSDRGTFLSMIQECFAQGMNDEQAIDALLAAGVIHSM